MTDKRSFISNQICWEQRSLRKSPEIPSNGTTHSLDQSQRQSVLLPRSFVVQHNFLYGLRWVVLLSLIFLDLLCWSCFWSTISAPCTPASSQATAVVGGNISLFLFICCSLVFVLLNVIVYQWNWDGWNAEKKSSPSFFWNSLTRLQEIGSEGDAHELI